MKSYKRKQLIDFVHMLGSILGKNIEVVLHIIEEDHSYIAAIENGYVSGRTEDSPLTELALSFIRNKVYVENQYVKNYRGITKDKKQIIASTFFIKDENNELEAMLCFNIDITKYKEISEQIFLLGNIKMPSFENDEKDYDVVFKEDDIEGIDFSEMNHEGEFIEYFSESLHDFFYSIVPKEYLDNNESLKLDQKIAIVRQLYNRGYFEIKGAVAQVANLLKVSEPSVYRYLKQVEQEG